MSEHVYARAMIEGNGWDLQPGRCTANACANHAVMAALPGKVFVFRCFEGEGTYSFEADLTGEEISTLDATVAAIKVAAVADALKQAKTDKAAAIDARTSELIAQGFVWAGKTFCLSLDSQINWTNIGVVPTLLTYPYKIATLLDDQIHEFADAVEIQAAYGTAVATKEAHVASGRELKEQVFAATTISEVLAVEDTR